MTRELTRIAERVQHQRQEFCRRREWLRLELQELDRIQKEILQQARELDRQCYQVEYAVAVAGRPEVTILPRE